MDAVHCNAVIAIFTILALAAGIFCGISFHDGDNEGLFTALAVGFVFLVIDYIFIEKREEIVTGRKVEKY